MTIRDQIEYLQKLEAGWYDGQGTAYDPAQLTWLAEKLDTFGIGENLGTRIYPSKEGGIHLEWNLGGYGGWIPTLDIDLANRSGYFHTLNLKTDAVIEKTLDLSDPIDWMAVRTGLEGCR